VVAFGLAAFMPFLVWRLMPLVTAAVVAQGVASGPLRAGAQAMQWQYYTQASLTRLTRPVNATTGSSPIVNRPWGTPSPSTVPTRLTTSGGG
jgi:hypothetical protein